MKYSSGDIMNFGKHKGHQLKEIFRFEPSYIEWAIKYIDDFQINLNEFEKLPTSTPYVCEHKHTFKIKNKEFKLGFFHPGESHIDCAKEFLQNGGVIPEQAYIFSSETKEILANKEKGLYNAPDWKPPSYLDEDFF